MENVDVTKENLCINKIVGQKKENFFVEDDAIIPDIKPDILNAISTNGNVCVYKKEVLDGKIRLDGTVNVYVMYLADSDVDTVRGVNTNIDFTHILDIENCRNDMNLDEKMAIKNIECKVLNGRKINVKVALELDATVYSNDNIEIVTNINNIEDIQMLNKELTINSMLGCGTAKAYAKDTIMLDETDNLAEILKCNLDIVNKDIKISYNKILAKADAHIQLMYLTEENLLKTQEAMIPIMGFIDMPNITEDNLCDLSYTLSNMVVKPNQAQEHSVYIETEVELSCMVYENKRVEIIQDLYSPTCNLEFSQKRISSSTDKCETLKEITVKDELQVPDVQEGSLLDVEVTPNLINTEITNSKIKYTGDLNLNFIFTNDSIVNSRSAKMPFEISVDNETRSDKINVDTEIGIASTNFEIQSRGEASCEVELSVDTKTDRNSSINIIDNVELSNEQSEQDEDYDSLILYIVKPGDSLWKIAKRFGSTVDELARMNGIEDENVIAIGQKIYIPKFKYVKKENSENAREQVVI